MALVRQTQDSRIATRHAFEANIRIAVHRNGTRYVVQGWTRDLSESGLAAFVAHDLGVGELVELEVPISKSETMLFSGRVARCRGTEYGFEFTAVSSSQRQRIRSRLRGCPAIPSHDAR